MTKTRLWAPFAHLPSGVATDLLIEHADGVITALTSGVTRSSAAAADALEVAGVVLPGFANAHSHAFHRGLRGRTHADGGTFWTWRKQMYALASRLDPDSYFQLARAVYAEMALAGMTVVGEFHYLHHDPDARPYADPNAMSEALVAAAADAGIRITMLDVCYLSGGLGEAGHLELDPVQQRFSDGSVAAWAQRVGEFADRHQGSGHVRVGSAAHSVRALPAAAIAEFATARPAGPTHIHLSEQPAENAAVQAFYGCSPTELLAANGLLGRDLTAVHATHLSGHDIELLGGTGTGSCFCPTTERDLADGIGPAIALARAGSPLSLGSDQHAVIDMFEELRGLEMHERLDTNQRGRFTPAELVTAGTSTGYEALGWAGGGRLQVGAPADLVVVDPASVRTAGAQPDQLHYAATASDVTDVFVAGERIVADRQHRLGNVGQLLASALRDLQG